jgi:anti-anti-sigma factor
VSPEEHRKGLQATIAYLNSIGVTTVKQQHAKNPIAIAAQSLEREGELHARIGLSWTWKGPLEPMPLDEQEKMIAERGRFASDLVKTEYVKFSGDGNAGSTGYVLEPYLQTKDRGINFFTDDSLFEEVEKFDRMGMGVTIHATGDAAVRQMIDAVSAELVQDLAQQLFVDETLNLQMTRGRTRLIIDMAEVTYIASAGVGTMLSAADEAENEGGKLVLLNPSKPVQEVLDLAFVDMFTIARSLAEAKALF